MSPCFVNTETRISCQGAQYFWHLKSWHKIVFLGELFQARRLVSVKVTGQKVMTHPQKQSFLKTSKGCIKMLRLSWENYSQVIGLGSVPYAVAHNRCLHSAFVGLGHVGVAAENGSEWNEEKWCWGSVIESTQACWFV